MGLVFVSEHACMPLIQDLREEGHELFLVHSTELVYDAVSAHPDLYMCRIGDTLVMDDAVRTTPDIRKIYEQTLEEKLGDVTDTPLIPAFSSSAGGSIVFQTGNIGHDYPYDVAYDAVSTGKYFLHHLAYTSPALLDRAREAGLEFLDVKQGYTKCACVVVGEQALITADRGIFRTVEAYNQMLREDDLESECIDCLLIEEGYVALPGLKYGFLGGASGLVAHKLYFNGDLGTHPDSDRIVSFVREHGVEPVWYEGETLTDIGSIVYLP